MAGATAQISVAAASVLTCGTKPVLRSPAFVQAEVFCANSSIWSSQRCTCEDKMIARLHERIILVQCFVEGKQLCTMVRPQTADQETNFTIKGCKMIRVQPAVSAI